jgi:hypothetical protein
MAQVSALAVLVDSYWALKRPWYLHVLRLFIDAVMVSPPEQNNHIALNQHLPFRVQRKTTTTTLSVSPLCHLAAGFVVVVFLYI